MKHYCLVSLVLYIVISVIGCGRPAIDVEKDLSVLRMYAEQYRTTNKRIANLETPPPRVADAINDLSHAGTRRHEPYVALILLKVYRNHYEQGHQSYELRENTRGKDEAINPILKEYCRLVSLNPRAEEFVSSEHVYRWVESHPALLEYKALADEYRDTKKLVDYCNRQFVQEIKQSKKHN